MPNWADGRRRGATSGPQRFRVSLRHCGNFLASQPLASAEVAFVVEAPLESDLIAAVERSNTTLLNQSAPSGSASAEKLEQKSMNDVSIGSSINRSSINDSSSVNNDSSSRSENHSNPSPCRAAVCVSGQWRTFANPRVRALFRENLLGGLNGKVWSQREKNHRRSSSNSGSSSTGGDEVGNESSSLLHGDKGEPEEEKKNFGQIDALNHCELDLFFYAKTTDAVSDRNYFFSRTASLPSSESAMREVLAREFPKTVAADARSRGGRGGGRIQIVHGDPPYPVPSYRNSGSDNNSGDGSSRYSRSNGDSGSDHGSSSGFDARSSDADDDASNPSSPSWVQAHAKVAWPALHSVRACFDMVQDAEAEEHRKQMHAGATAKKAKASSIAPSHTPVEAPSFTAAAAAAAVEAAAPPSPTVDATNATASQTWRYDWVVRTRFDLAYLWPLPPLPTFDLHRGAREFKGKPTTRSSKSSSSSDPASNSEPLPTSSQQKEGEEEGIDNNEEGQHPPPPRHVLTPYTSLPISDVFAIAPRSHARSYFEADDECRNASLTASDFQVSPMGIHVCVFWK